MTHDRTAIWNRVAQLLCAAFGDIPEGRFEVHVEGQSVSITMGDVGIEHDSADGASWALGHWTHSPGSFECPPESDFVENGRREKSLDDAVVAMAGIIAQGNVLSFLEREAEARYYAALEHALEQKDTP